MYAGSEDAPSYQKQSAKQMLKEYFESSTLHGTAYWVNAKHVLARLLWVFFVFFGICGSVYVINNCVYYWNTLPITSSKSQSPIEAIPFASITICPLDVNE